MKRLFCFILLLVVITGLWFFSIEFVVQQFGLPANAAEAGDMFGGINALFSGLALAGVIFAVWLQTKDVQTNQKNLEKTIESNKQSLEIMALSSLIQEADSALLRYERWEQKEGAGNYENAKAKVREKLVLHRNKLEKKLTEIEKV